MSTPSIPADAGRSWWLHDALAADPGEPAPPLDRDTTADVVVLGGGYTGMWTAWFLKEAEPELDIVLLEQDICGGGPSGRNGGFVNSWWSALGELSRRFGDAQALALCRAGEASVAAIGRFCEEHGVDAWFRPDGDLGAASSEAQIGYWAENVMAADRLDMPELFRVVDRESVRELIDTPRLHGGIYTSMGATVQPARLARGIRRALMERGVRIHEQSPVTRFGSGTPAVAETPGGTVRAGVAIVALNAWAAHWKRFRRLLTVRGSYIALTASAPEKLEELRWTNGMGLWDHRAALHYVRTTPDGRIAFGVGGMQPGLARSIGPRFSWDDRAVRIAAEDSTGCSRRSPTCRSRRRGAGRSMWPVTICRSSAPWSRATCTTDTAIPGTASGRLISGDRSWRRWRWGRPATCSPCRSSPSTDAVPTRTDPLPRGVRREPGDLAEGSARGSGRGAEPHRGLRRSSPAPDGVQPGPMTAGDVRPRTVRSRAPRAARGSPPPMLRPYSGSGRRGTAAR